MKSNIQLSISPAYINNWSYLDACRELFQNAIDQETIDSENKYFIMYDNENNTLRVGNKISTLSRKTLLLGSSSKRDDRALIGTHGEGYKLALLVLTRDNLPTKIYNYGSKEVWTPSIEYSNQYESEVLNIEIDKYYFKSVPDSDLVFEITNFTEDMYSEVCKTNINLEVYPESIKTSKGKILTSEDQVGRIYVNGLYISTIKEDIACGYDINTANIDLDRDRKLVSSFDIFWMTSAMWLEVGNTKKAIELTKTNAPDVKYMSYHLGRSASTKISDTAYSEFTKEHGNNSRPVINQAESEVVRKQGLAPVIVSPSYYSLVTYSSHFPNFLPDVITAKTPTEILTSALLTKTNRVKKISESSIRKLIEDSKMWNIKNNGK